MKIGDEVYIHGYVDEIRKDTVIIQNEGGYFGTVSSEIKPKTEWIPVSYRMPIVGENVLICDLDGNMYVSYLHAEGRRWGYDDGGDKIKNIIAWMPLPEPYKESEVQP